MVRTKFSLAGLLGIVGAICAGWAFYEVATEPPLPTMPPSPGCMPGYAPGRVYDPLERVYIAGPSDSDEIEYSPNY